MKAAIHLMEKGLIPESLVRHGIRRLLRDRLREQGDVYSRDRQGALLELIRGMRAEVVAPSPEKANEQHYELPPEFFQLVLGRHLKYSSAYYEAPETTLSEAEGAMLALTAKRAGLENGQRVLELGCGWGSLTLWMAEHFPDSCILAVSNSSKQRDFIERRAQERGLDNLKVVTRDMNEFETDQRFDRIVSVEMFEHMRNWEQLLGRVAGWLDGDGARLFLHVFAHERYAYPFEDRDSSDWMSRWFFTGGLMPAHDLIEHLDTPLEIESSWVVNGEHYARTSEDWVRNLDRNRTAAMKILSQAYGPDARVWFRRWRTFFLACAELFAFDHGRQWIVSHQLIRPRGREA